MTIGSCHETNIKPYNAKEIMEKGDYYSLCKLNTGTSFVSIKKNNPFFAIFPRPESGYYNQMLDSKTLQIQFLKECGNEDFYNTLVYLNTRKNSNFTDKLLEKELNITSSRSKEIINILLKYNLLKTTELELDDTKIITYNLNDNPAIIGFFAFLDLLVTQQRGYYFGVYDGQGEYFK